MRVTEIPDTWKPDPGPAQGYDPGPELAATHNGLTLTVQRTHTHRDTTVYYWQVTIEGRSIPMADGTYSTDQPLHKAAADIAWQLYAGPTAHTLAHLNNTLTWWNGAITPNAVAIIHELYELALT